jgi:hypothetical protein
MSLWVLQIIVKQWDKSQTSPAHVLQRAAIVNQRAIHFPPVSVLDQRCIIDQHGDDIQGNRVKQPVLSNDILIFDRFYINMTHQSLAYCDGKVDNLPHILGSLNQQWLQCQYNCRYKVFESGLYYWLYEEVTVNAAWLTHFDADVFLTSAPARIYRDINDLDALRKS